MSHRRALAGAAFALAGILILTTQTSAQVKQGKTRPLTTKQLMAGLVKPQTTTLGESLKDPGPADAKGWEAAATHAALLNESGHAMMADGRCPDAAWENACKMLDEATRLVIAKVEARDVAGAREGLTMVTKSCAACHSVHKK
jgi:cytochrome c556